MSSALRVAVPLKSMCSTKCAMPLRSAVSWRDPRVSHTPMLIERTCDICSVRIRSPLSRTSRTIKEFDKVTSSPQELVADPEISRAPQTIDVEGITVVHHYTMLRPFRQAHRASKCARLVGVRCSQRANSFNLQKIVSWR